MTSHWLLMVQPAQCVLSPWRMGDVDGAALSPAVDGAAPPSRAHFSILNRSAECPDIVAASFPSLKASTKLLLIEMAS